VLPDIDRRRERRERGIAWAAFGLFVAIVVGLPLKLLGIIHISYAMWAVLAIVTAAAELALWLTARHGWDQRILPDPHFIVLPTVVFAALLNLYAFLAPDGRHFLMMMWFVALLFLAGHAGFLHVAGLSAVMAVGQVLAIGTSPWRDPGIRMADTVALAVVFWIINVYAGLIFDRLRKDRRQMRSLRQQLAELALTDPLTGLANRRRFREVMGAERTRAARYGGPFCVAMLDVDHFKNFNDSHGHPAGDAVLIRLASILRGALRDGDLVARFGGEEFAILMVNTGGAAALPVLERLRATVEATRFDGAEVQPQGRLTVSAGVAEWTVDGVEEESLLAAADAALYRAKAAGRNRVVRAEALPR
jgi:diguanylate cyclase (GGDEF)-like protein